VPSMQPVGQHDKRHMRAEAAEGVEAAVRDEGEAGVGATVLAVVDEAPLQQMPIATSAIRPVKQITIERKKRPRKANERDHVAWFQPMWTHLLPST
jgi:hypothetical protein